MGVHPACCHFRMVSCTGCGRVFSTLSSVQPGLTAFTVICRGASATAKYHHNTSSAALAAPMATHGCQLPKRPPGA